MKTLKESLLDDPNSQIKDLRRLQIEEWLKNNCAKSPHFKYRINNDYTINVSNFNYIGSGNFPEYIQFKDCDGYFSCINGRMTMLRGCPRWVGESFSCRGNFLKDLIGGPKKVGEGYYCQENNLISLKGAPHIINGDFDIQDNKLKKYNGPLEIGGDIYCNNCGLDEEQIQWIKDNVDCGIVYDYDPEN